MRTFLLLLALLSLSASAQTPPTHVTTLQPAFGSGDGFGSRIAMSGAYAVVGGNRQSYGDPGSDAVHVLQRTGTLWRLTQRLRPEGPQLRFFGSAVAMGDSVMFVGAFSESPVDDQGTGFVHVYRLAAAGRWEHHATLRPPGTGRQHFGYSLAYDGTHLMVGAPGAFNYAGRVYVYRREGSEWVRIATLSRMGTSQFGYSVALDGMRAVVYERGSQAHRLLAYRLDADAWTFDHLIAPPHGFHPVGDLAVSLDGDDLAVGMARNSQDAIGRVELFRHDGSTWAYVGHLQDPATPAQHTDFGKAVALAEGFLLIGAARSRGRLLVYERTGTGWQFHISYVLGNPEGCPASPLDCEFRGLGAAIAADGAYALVGAPETAFQSPSGAGSVHSYQRVSSSWVPRHDISIGPWQRLHRFGESVSLGGTRVAVGARADRWGSAYVFNTATATPLMETRITESAFTTNDVALAGTRLMVVGDRSMSLYDRTSGVWSRTYLGGQALAGDQNGVRLLTGLSTGAPLTGRAQVYDQNGTAWIMSVLPVVSPGPTFGHAVALDGARAFVSAPGVEAGPYARPGAVYVFEYDGAAWTLGATLHSPDPDHDPTFGRAIAASGGRLLVGAPPGSAPGAAWVFEGLDWAPVARFDGETPTDGFGHSVALDGSRAIIGAPHAHTAAGGEAAGRAYTYVFTGGGWTALGALESARPVAGERFGTSVDVEGRRFAVGAPYPVADANDFGAVYVFHDASAVAADDAPTAPSARVSAPFPNPTASAAGTRLRVSLHQPEGLRVRIVDLLGRAVRQIEVAGHAGHTDLSLDTRGLAPGRYAVHVAGASFSETVSLTITGR